MFCERVQSSVQYNTLLLLRTGRTANLYFIHTYPQSKMKYLTILLVLAVSIVQVACRSDPIPATLSWSSNPKRGIHATTDKNLNIDPLKQDSTRVTRPNQIRAGAQTRQITTKKAVALGMLLALNSGVVNGVCLSGLLHSTKQASAAVTGAWTNSALGAATGNTDQFAFNGKCILSYFFGSFLSGLVNPNPKAFEISVGSVRTAFLIGSALLCASSVMVEQPGREFIFLAAMANGIQNSLTSTTTANLVRSAHFSGITSGKESFCSHFYQ